MSGPRFIGIRDVVDPYKGLQDSVSKVGDIYRQYNKDIQEADRIRNEEARQSEQLGMQRTAHEIAVGEHTEKERIRGVTRDFDPYTAIGSNYGIHEKFIPELDKLDQQVRDYYKAKEFDTTEEAEQARQGVEKSLSAVRGEARDRDLAKRQYIDHLRQQGVPIERAVVLAEAATSGYGSHSEMAANLQAQAKDEDDRALALTKNRVDILKSLISANKGNATGGTSGGNTGSGSSGSTVVTPAEIEKAKKDFAKIIGDGFSIFGVGWSGDATEAAHNVVTSIRETNAKRQTHNELVTLGKRDGPLLPPISFDEGINWLTETTSVANVDNNVQYTKPGAVKTFIEDRAAERDFNNAAKAASKQKGGLAGLVTGDDVESFMPQRTPRPPVSDVVLKNVTASYARLFPEAFPQAVNKGTPTTAGPRPEVPADGEGKKTASETNDGDGDKSKNTIVTNENPTPEQSEQPEQPISREVLLPYKTESPTPAQVNINSAVTRMAEIQRELLDTSISNDKRRELFRESQETGDSIRRLPDGDRILETIVTNARQARMQNIQDQTKAGKEHSSRESIIKEVLQINERLAGNLSPEVRRINEEQLKSLEKDFPSLGDSSSIGKEKFDSYISKLESQIRHRSAPGRVLGSSKTLSNLQQELNEAKRLAGYQKTGEDRVPPLDGPTPAQLQEEEFARNARFSLKRRLGVEIDADVQRITRERAAAESEVSRIQQEIETLAPGIRMKDQASIQQAQELGNQLREATGVLSNLNLSGPRPVTGIKTNPRNIPAPAKPTNTVKKALGGSTDSDPDGLNTLTEDKTVLPSPVDSKIPILKTPKGMTENPGVVYDTKEGDAINTVKAGRVAAVEHIRGGGTTVIVEHNDGILTTYTDWSDNSYVNTGDWVEAGQLLMYASGAQQKTRFNVYGKNRLRSYNPSYWLEDNAPKKK